MGISIVVKNADFSNLGLGNIDPLVNFFNNAGVVSNTIKNAYRNILVKKIVDAGLWDLLDVIYTFEGNSSYSQGLNIKNPFFDDVNYGAFLNDASAGHTSLGFVSDSATKRVMDTNFKVPVGGFLNGFAMGVYNSTIASSSGLLGMLTQSTPVNVGQLGLGRDEVGGYTLGYYGGANVGGAWGPGHTEETGLLQILVPKDDANMYLVDKGVLRASAAKTTEPQGESRSIILAGNRLHTDGTINNASSTTIPFAYFSKKGLTVAQGIKLNEIVLDFLTAVGRN